MLELDLNTSSTLVIFAPLVDSSGYIKQLKQKYPNIAIIDCNLLPELTLAAFKNMADKKITTILSSNHSTAHICIRAADILFPLGPPPFFYLQSLTAKKPKLSFIFFTAQTPLTERLRVRFLSAPMLFENIHYAPLDKKALPFKNKQQAKNFFLLLNNNQRRILRMLVRGAENIPSALKPDQEYLEKLNIANKRYGRWRLISPLLETAALEVTEGLREPLILHKQRIIIGTQDITARFSPQQQELLRLLLKNRGRTISRETIARTLWGVAYWEKYSDWAIDRLVCSLRRKLARLWIKPNRIQTEKKYGFRLIL